MTDTFFTIEEPAEGLFKDKGSRFIAYAWPVESEEQVREHVRMLKKEHHAARHHCFAWRMGTEGELFRVNDDGEPSSTAGKPILGQIQRLCLTNILIVVVRYFGGTLLGVSGLIHAYSEAAADVLQNARIVTKVAQVPFSVSFDYLQMNSVMKIFKDRGLPQIKSDFDLRCRIESSVRKSEADLLFALFRQIEGVTTEPGS